VCSSDLLRRARRRPNRVRCPWCSPCEIDGPASPGARVCSDGPLYAAVGADAAVTTATGTRRSLGGALAEAAADALEGVEGALARERAGQADDPVQDAGDTAEQVTDRAEVRHESLPLLNSAPLVVRLHLP